MQFAHKYADRLAPLIPGCIGFVPSGTCAPLISDKGTGVQRTPSLREACVRGLTLSRPLFAQRADGTTLLVADVPVVFETDGLSFVVINGLRRCIMQRLRLTLWVPLSSGVVTPLGMLRKGGKLRKGSAEPGWSEQPEDVENILLRRAEYAPEACFDAHHIGTRRVVTQEEAVLRLLTAAIKMASTGDAYNPFEATHIIHRSLCTGEFPGKLKGCTQLMASSNELAQRAQQQQIVYCRDMQHLPLQARYVHPSEFGYLCPVHTPDGDKVGLTRYLAAGCVVSKECDPAPWVELARSTPGALRLSVNGLPVDVFVDWHKLRSALDAKRDAASAAQPTLQRRGDDVYLWCDAGRLLAWCNDGKLHEAGELFDARDDSVEPTRPMSIVAEQLPYCHMNQPARSCFACAQLTHATGMPAPERSCYQQTTRRLWYAQKPLVQSACASDDAQVLGVNAIVAICPLEGSMEDAIWVKKSSLERGMFRTDYDQRYINAKQGADNDDEDGVPAPGLMRKAGTTCGPARLGDAFVKCTFVGKDANGDGMTVTCDSHDTPLRKGDKVASRHGQKHTIKPKDGVDMPFCPVTGTTPDIIFNPHSLPSRMSVGQLAEMVAAILAAIEGCIEKVKPWQKDVLSVLKMRLQQNSLAPSGATRLVDGRTGAMLKSVVLMGPVLYTHQPHTAKHKAYCVGGNATVDAAQQPVAGKRNGGALRCGEMETKALQSAGCSSILRDVLVRHCDGKKALLCRRCNMTDRVHYATRRCMRDECRSLEPDVQELASLPIAVEAGLMRRFSAMGIEIMPDVSQTRAKRGACAATPQARARRGAAQKRT